MFKSKPKEDVIMPVVSVEVIYKVAYENHVGF